MKNLKWLKIRQSSWYYPAIYGILSALFAVLLTIFDSQFDGANIPTAFKPFFISVDLAVQILNTVVLVSSTILTFTFSTTMVVLTNFSSQYSESLVDNFLNNTVTLKAFGIFFGGFTYTITSLLLFDMNMDNEKVIVASVCIIYVIVDLIYFNGFIRAVINYIQPNGLIVRLHNEAEDHLDIYERSLEDKEILAEAAFQLQILNFNI